MDMPSGSDDDAWKIFNRDTEAGRLLSRLYGVAPSGRVSYPKQRRRRRVADSNADDDNDEGTLTPTRSWKTTYTVHGWSKAAEEEKEQERKENIARALSMAVPKVGIGPRHSVNNGNSANQISHMPRRKTALTCRITIDETLQKKRHYRPPHSNAISSDKEKRRLNEIFGGTGRCLPVLPEDLTSIPLSPKKDDTNKSSAKDESGVSRPSTLFDQIVSEIQERREHQMAMEEMGSGEATRESTAHEIKARLERLKRIDSQRAIAMVQKMMNR